MFWEENFLNVSNFTQLSINGKNIGLFSETIEDPY